LQPRGNTGGQDNALRLSCHDANRREHKESIASNRNSLPAHIVILQVLRCLFNLGPRALEMLQAPCYLNPALHGAIISYAYFHWQCFFVQ